MRTFTAVVFKELLERRLIFAAALLVGLLPLIASWTVTWRGISPGEMRDYSALVLASLLTVGTALAVGSSLICRELTQGRLSFYYVRPVGSWSLWSGKLAAAMVLVTAATVLAWLPSLAAGSRPWGLLASESPSTVWLPQPFPRGLFALELPLPEWAEIQERAILLDGTHSVLLGAAVALVLLILLAHAAGIFTRVRSAWLLFDLVMLWASVGLLALAADRLSAHGAFYGLWRGAKVVVVTLVLACLVAPGIQLAFGRSRPSRAHGFFSLALWTPLVAVAGGLLADAHLTTRAAPGDLDEVLDFEAAPQGPWAFVGGVANARNGYWPAFALNVEDGGFLPLDPMTALGQPPVFSADGRVVAWSRCSETWCDVLWKDLDPRSSPLHSDPPAPRIKREQLRSYFADGEPLALDAGGRRLALVQEGQVAVYDLGSGSLVAAARLPSAWVFGSRLRFIADDTIRFSYRWWKSGERRLNLWELDIPSRRWRLTGSLPGWEVAWDPPTDRLLSQTGPQGEIHEEIPRDSHGEFKVFDGQSGNELYTLDYQVPVIRTWRKEHVSKKFVQPVHTRFLSAGRIAAAELVRPKVSRVLVFSPQGAELRRIDLDVDFIVLGGEPAAGRLLVAVPRNPGPTTSLVALGGRLRFDRGIFETRLFDLESGRTLGRYPGLVPNPRSSRTGSLAARTLFGDRGAPFRLDVESGDVEPLLPLDGALGLGTPAVP